MARTTCARRKTSRDQILAVRKQLQRELSWAAGTEAFRHRDPVYHVTEGFRFAFDRSGQRGAQAAERRSTSPLVSDSSIAGFSGAWKEQAEDTRRSADRTAPGTQTPMRQFAQAAFQRGNMAGAVLQGTGKLMLISCLRRTAGQSQPTKEQQRTLFDTGAKIKKVPGFDPNKVVYNRGFVNSAVGLVVDALQDARRTVELMTGLVQGGKGLGPREGADTLRTVYPFLDDSREQGLLEQYRRSIQTAQTPEEKALLHSAIIRTRALVEKKAQMKQEFIQKLRLLSDRANEALEEFQAPDFVDSLMQALTQEETDDSDQPEDSGQAGDEGGPGEPSDPEPGDR